MKGVIRLKELRSVIRERVRSEGIQVQEYQVNAVILALQSVVRRAFLRTESRWPRFSTYDHFCLVDDRATIIKAIAHAADLSRGASERVLASVESLIDRALVDSQGRILVEDFGLIEDDSPGYWITTQLHWLGFAARRRKC